MSGAWLIQIIIGFLAGAGLAAAHFGGLWATLRIMADLPSPRLGFWVSVLLRFGLTLGGFYLLLLAGPGFFFPALLGFLLARMLVSALACGGRTPRRTSSWK